MSFPSQTFSAVSIKSSNDALTIISTADSTQVLRVNTCKKVVTIRNKLIVDTILWTSIDPNSGGLPPISASVPRVVEVHPTLASATIAAGITAAMLLMPAPSTIEPVIVRIYPAIYDEDNTSPIVVPNGIYLCGLCPETIIVVPTQDGIIFRLAGNNVVSNLRVSNIASSNNTAFESVGSNAWFDNVLIQNVAYGITHTGSNLKITNCQINNTSAGSATTNGIQINSASSQVDIHNTEFNTLNPATIQTTTALLVEDGMVRIQNCTFIDPTTSIRITGGIVTVEDCSFICANNPIMSSAINVSNSGELVVSNIVCIRTGGTFNTALSLFECGQVTINNITCSNLQSCASISTVTEKVTINGFVATDTTTTAVSVDSSTNIFINDLCVSNALTALYSCCDCIFTLTNSVISGCTNGIIHNTNLTTASVVQNCIVTTTANAVVVINAKMNISNLDVTGANFGVDYNGSSVMNITSCIFLSCTTGVRSINNLSSSNLINNCTFTLGNTGVIIDNSSVVISGSYFNAQNVVTVSAVNGSRLNIIGTNISGNAVSGIQAENAGTLVRLYNCSLVVDMLNAINLIDQASVEVCNSVIKLANTGINSDTSVTSVTVTFSTLDNNTDFGENVTVTSLTGSADPMTSRQLVQRGTVFGQDATGIYNLDVLGAGLCVGGFGPYGSSYRILTDTGAGVFVDETDSSQFGGNYTYPGVGVNNTIYIGALSKFSGFRTTIANTVSVLNDYRVEYWDGAMWSIVTTLSTTTNAPYTSIANNIFSTNGNNTNEETVRLGQLTGNPWVAVDVNGTILYWIRIRIQNTITTSPTLSKTRLTWHSRYVREDTGFCEYFGNARPAKLLNMYADAQDSMPGNIDSTSGTINIDGGNFAFQNDRIEYPPGVETSKMWRIHLPPDIDTSLPLEFNWSWYKSSLPVDDNTNSVLFTIMYGIVLDANSVDESGGVLPNRAFVTSNIITQTLPVSNSQYNATFPLVANTIVMSNAAGAPMTLWVALKRSSFDTNLDNVVVTQISIGYTGWRDGGYIKYPI